tara:strand:- start:700 stop:861 length:162 start_codon:yes stop_codon:yes gene_type:complete
MSKSLRSRKHSFQNDLGAIAQLVEHLHGMQGVSGSSPLGSINISRISKGFQGD